MSEMRHGYCRCIRDTNGKILSGLCPLSALESERDKLKGEVEDLQELKRINDAYDKSLEPLIRSRDTFKNIAGELAEALKAQIQMRDMKKPTKLEEELSWRENDELAAKMGEEALAAYDKAVKGIS